MRILVADDEPEMTLVLAALLKREHYSVDVVHNGQDALDYGLAGRYDCIVLDIMMPKLDGIQALRALRAGHIATPVLLLTARSQVEDRVAGLDSGADDYLPKPFDNREFAARIRALTRRGGAYTPQVLTAGNITLDCAAIGLGNYCVTINRIDKAISILYQNGGSFLPPDARFDPSDFRFQVTPETAFETRYFIVELTAQKEMRSADLEHIAALDRQTVVDTVSRVIEAGTARGYVDYYRFGIFFNEDGGSTVIVVDSFLQLQAVNNMLRITAVIFLACILIVFALLLVLSKRAIRPFVGNLERQRQFVTDASHELKTPLAILSADLGLLENAADPWLESARAQIVRMDRLIKNLVELARTEETIREDAAVCFSVSEAAQASADAFQPLAEADGKALTAEIAGGLTLKGVPDNFFRLFAILLDNAVKYCDPGGTIRLKAVRRGRNLCLSVSNPCAGVDTAQLPRYFDRFYRADSSRDRPSQTNHFTERKDHSYEHDS